MKRVCVCLFVDLGFGSSVDLLQGRVCGFRLR